MVGECIAWVEVLIPCSYLLACTTKDAGVPRARPVGSQCLSNAVDDGFLLLQWWSRYSYRRLSHPTRAEVRNASVGRSIPARINATAPAPPAADARSFWRPEKLGSNFPFRSLKCPAKHVATNETSRAKRTANDDASLTLTSLHANVDDMAFRPLSRLGALSRSVVMPQRRTFLGLQRPPPPQPQMMGYLVAQGLAIVLLADLAFATVTNEPTTIRSLCQTAGFWKDTPPFDKTHDQAMATAVEE